MDVDAFLDGGFEAVLAARDRVAASNRVQTAGAAGPGPAGAAADVPSGQPPAAPRRPSAAARHRAQLQALQAKDPEFFEYLQHADQGLLEFGDDDGSGDDGSASDGEAASSSSSEGGELSDVPVERDIDPGGDVAAAASSSGEDGDGGAGPAAPLPARAPPVPANLQDSASAAQVLAWCTAHKDALSLRSLRQLLASYRAACHVGEADGDDSGMRIESGAVFNQVILFVLREVDAVFWRLLGLQPGGGQGGQEPAAPAPTPTNLRRSPRWRKLEPLVKSYLGNTLHLLDAMADPSMTAFILRRLRPSAPLFAVSERLQRKGLKAAVAAFGRDHAGTTMQAALFLRAAAASLGPAALDAALKGAYREFVKGAKFTSPSTAAHLGMQAACIVELYGLDTAASYAHAFTYVRQLAQLVRGAMGAKAKDAFRQVYCWQTVSCLELWARLVVDLAGAGGGELRALAFPVAQLLASTVALVPTARYYPLHLRCLRALVGLARGTRLYTPVAPALLDMLAWKGLARAPKGAAAVAAPPPADAMLLRASKAALASPTFQRDVVEQVMELLADHLAQWAYSPAFPELALPTVARLRAFAKRTPVAAFRTASRGLVAAIDANAAFVGTARSRAEFAPADFEAVAAFLAAERQGHAAPLDKYADLLAQRARDRRTLQAAQEVRLGSGRRRAEAAGDDSSSDDGEHVERPKKVKKVARAPLPAPPAPPAGDWDEEAEDVVQDYNLSDSD